MYRLIRTTLVAGVVLFSAAGTAPAETLNQNQIEAILMALDNGYRTVTYYESVVAVFGPRQPFTDVIKTEYDHIGHLSSLLQAEDVSVPVNPYGEGGLPVSEVPATIEEACAIAMHEEVRNSELFVARLLPTATGNSVLMAIFNELRDTSEQIHMPAFRRCKGSR